VKIYRRLVDDNIVHLCTKNPKVLRKIRRYVPPQDKTFLDETIELDFVDKKTKTNGKLSDFIGFIHTGLLVNEHLKNQLNKKLSLHGTWMPLILEGTKLWYFSNLAEVDIIDLDKTDFVKVQGYITDIKKIVLKNNVPEFDFFCPKDFYEFGPFLSKRFIDFVREYKLSGILSKELKVSEG
jgi:hypothetical protein